jgi:outer membrane protein OmpA-like peptidoglycan-associated protein
MKKNLNFPMTLIAAAVLASCSSMPQNSQLTEAHRSYDAARSDPQVATLAPSELREAGDSLAKADNALNKDENEAKVNQLAYIAGQKVKIAKESAQRKAAEQEVAQADARRDQVRLAARTAEADASRAQVAVIQQKSDQQATALAVAGANTERDHDRIEKQAMQLKELNAKKTQRGMVITLGDVLFNTNKAEVKPGGMRNVQKLADYLNQYPQERVLIEGYTDSTGSESLNQRLSERRAEAVRHALSGMGVSSDRIDTRGYGESYPIVGNDTAANRQMNRRVEIVLSDENGKIAPR